MKKAIKKLVILFSILAVFTACDENDDDLKIAEVTAVETLYSPEDEASINLETPSNVTFEWQPARSGDNGYVIYEIIFDTENGDFSSPVFVAQSDEQGFQSRKTLTSAQLNQIAGLAGIGIGETGRVKWSVWSSKGLDVKLAQESRILEIVRPNSFPTPPALYITGSASEGGDDLSQARQFVSTGQTTFEIYTMLSPGSYKFITALDGSGIEYNIEDNSLDNEGVTNYEGDSAVHRIRVDFSDNSVSIATIDDVQLWFSPEQDFWFSFDYVGNGKWEALDKYIEFRQESWGRDERYKFMFTVTSNNSTTQEWYGSVNADNQRPNENTPDDYFYMVPVNDSAYDFTFKFATELDMSQANLEIIFNNTVPEYTHVITAL